jgi:hypothetical protein
MPVPWLVVGQLVLNNLDKIIGVVKPGFTRKKAETEAASSQPHLISQQIAELQAAASNNAEQIAALATQVKDLVASLALAAEEAAAQRAAARRLAIVASGIAIVALGVAVAAIVVK